ncbi:hypothetical protein [Mycobacterium sp.]|jgi:hypothetical protein
MTIEGDESSFARGAALAWKVVLRVLPALRMIAAREKLEITVEIKRPQRD